MIKTIINKFVKAALDELFLDAPSVQLSMGADMFSDSKINLSNLVFRPDIFDISLQPFTLVSGHLGNLNIEGIAELALGGKLKFQAEDLFLLFTLEKHADAEKVQTMKKILLELSTGKFSNTILSEILKKLQGFPTSPEVDIVSKRKLLYKAMDYLSKGIYLSIKNIHIRFEFPMEGVDRLVDSIGIMIPLVKFTPAPAALRPENVTKHDPTMLIQCKSIQCYCDYERVSYHNQGNNVRKTFEHFKTQWKTEVHSAIFAPFDFDLVIGLNIKRRTGLVCPNVVFSLPQMKLSFDEKQLEVLHRVVDQMVKHKKRFEQLIRIQKIFRNGFPLPRVHEVGGLNLLPHLMLKNTAYPSQCNAIPRSNTMGIVAFMKERVGNRWTVMLWKHLIRLVIRDLQQTRPFGRWIEMARLAWIRKEYAFMYAQYYKRMGDSTNFVFNPQANINATKVRQLFEYEMMLPIDTVMMFRALAYMVATAGLFHTRRKAYLASNPPVVVGNGLNAAAGAGVKVLTGKSLPNAWPTDSSWESTFVGWQDILRVYIELFEAQRETGFHRFDRSHMTDGDSDDLDVFDGNEYETSTQRSSTEEGNHNNSIYSFSMHSRTAASAKQGPSSPTKMDLSASNNNNNSSSSSNKVNVISLQATAKKLFGNFSLGNMTGPSDEYDKKFFGKFDLNAFGELFNLPSLAGVNAADAANLAADSFQISQDVEHNLKYGLTNGRAKSPNVSQVAEAVQWAILRHRNVLTWMPPDVQVKIEKLSVELKTPLTFKQRERIPIAAVHVQGLSLSVNISQSSHLSKKKTGQVSSEGISTKKTYIESHRVKSLRGFASLSGALIQFRFVAKQVSVALQLLPMVVNRAEGSRNNNTLWTGLPSYPINENASETSGPVGKSQKSRIDVSLHSAPSTEGEHDEEDDDGSVSVDPNIAMVPVALKTIPGVDPAIKYIPGQTIISSMQQMNIYQPSSMDDDGDGEAAEDSIKYDRKLEEMANQRAAAKAAGYTIDTTMEDMAASSTTRIVGASSRGAAAGGTATRSGAAATAAAASDLRDIISSAPGENAFVFCLILDLDDKGEGAGDVQIQVGGMRLDGSKKVCAALIHPSFAVHLQTVLHYKSMIDTILPVLSEPLVVIDWEHYIPMSVLSCDPPASVLDQMLREVEAEAAEQRKFNTPKKITKRSSRSQLSTEDDETSVLIDDSQEVYRPNNFTVPEDEELTMDDIPSLPPHNGFHANHGHTAATFSHEELLRQRKARREAIAMNKNIMQWLGFLEARLPRILSLCVRTSPIVIQSLESTVIRDLVYAKLHSVVQKAAKRQKDQGMDSDLPVEHVWGMLSHLILAGFDSNPEISKFQQRITAFRRMKKWGTKGGAAAMGATPMKGPAIPGTAPPQSAFKVKLLLPAVELVVAKAIVPYPALDVHVQGMAVLKLPMSDETLCHYLAWLLADFMPMYY